MKRQLVTRGVLLTLAVALAVPQALASGQRPPSLVFERNLSATGDWHGGEPQVAVRGDDVVVVWPEVDNTGVYRNPITGTLNTAVGTVVGYANDPAFSRCGLAISHDGGRTFRRTILPAQTAQSTLCSDAITAFGPHGEVYAGTITFNQPTTPLPLVPPGTLPHLSPVQPGQGSADVVISSRDRGETWSHPRSMPSATAGRQRSAMPPAATHRWAVRGRRTGPSWRWTSRTAPCSSRQALT